MIERPILMSAPMVLALLEDRKGQTRRIIKFPSTGAFVCVQGYWTPGVATDWWPLVSADGESSLDNNGNETPMRCPYGKPGDRLWVREAWRTSETLDHLSGKLIGEASLKAGYTKPWAPLRFLADGRVVNGDVMRPATGEFGRDFGRYRHARFMPRWASRISLEIIEVRVQQLQQISADDAVAEGLDSHAVVVAPGTFTYRNYDHHDDEWCANPVLAYSTLWDSINGPGSWNANPWVWAVSFRRWS